MKKILGILMLSLCVVCSTAQAAIYSHIEFAPFIGDEIILVTKDAIIKGELVKITAKEIVLGSKQGCLTETIKIDSILEAGIRLIFDIVNIKELLKGSDS